MEDAFALTPVFVLRTVFRGGGIFATLSALNVIAAIGLALADAVLRRKVTLILSAAAAAGALAFGGLACATGMVMVSKATALVSPEMRERLEHAGRNEALAPLLFALAGVSLAAAIVGLGRALFGRPGTATP
jgi:hypothetical protein